MPLSGQVNGGGEDGGGEEGSGVPTATVVIECNRVRVDFKGVTDVLSSHYWDFGDGSPVVKDSLNITHYYTDANFYTMKWKYRVSPLVAWTEYEFPVKAIFVGSGCGSVRKISDLLAKNVLTASPLVGATLYSFGDLEADMNYIFDGCHAKILPGSLIKVINGKQLTLQNGTYEAHLQQDCDKDMWNGFQVIGASSLVAYGTLIQDALYGISPVEISAANLPRLALNGTIFEGNYIGINATSGRFSLQQFQNNRFAGKYIPLEPKFCSGGGALPFPYRNWSYAGIYTNRSSLLAMPGNSAGNVFENLPVGIRCAGTNAIVRGCDFKNITLDHLGNQLPSPDHGTALIYASGTGPDGNTDPVLSVKNCTMDVCDRGVLANINNALAIVSIAYNTLTRVQNGIEVTGEKVVSGLYCRLKNNIVHCNRYKISGIRHKNTVTGIDVRSLSTAATLIADTNHVTIDIVHAFRDSVTLRQVYPVGINIINMAASSVQPSACSASRNVISVLNGVEAIRLENVINANVMSNDIALNSTSTLPKFIAGIHAIHCTDAVMGCNNIGGQAFVKTLGMYSESCSNLSFDENMMFRLGGGASLYGLHSTTCSVSRNKFIAFSEHPTGEFFGLYYNDAVTGPQYKTGNTWEGDFGFGAGYLYEDYSYCLSRYTVTPLSNVGAFNPLNPVVVSMADNNCDGWFIYEDGTESSPGCGGSTAQRIAGANAADVVLTSGGFSDLEAGWRWSAETEVYRKFAEHPEWTGEHASIQGFMQTALNGVVGQTYVVRQLLADIQTPFAINDDGMGWLDQIEEGDTEEALRAGLAQWKAQQPAGGGPDSTSYREKIMSLKVMNAHIPCSSQPCQNEQWLYNLYATVALERSREMSDSEAAQLRNLAQTCASAGGPSVYLARSWHYILTGERLKDPCAASVFFEGTEERRSSKKNDLPQTLLVAPNPANVQVTVSIPPASGAVRLQMSDLYGRTVYGALVAQGETSINIDATSLAAGLYLLRLFNSEGRITDSSRIVIAH